jgi:vanillate O-demethylase ferredoxin subunit
MNESDAMNLQWMDAVVADVKDEGASTRMVRLAGVDCALPAAAPGAHVAVRCGDLVRHYSLCAGTESTDSYVLGVKLAADSRGGSRWIFDHVQPGVTLKISAPRNHFPLKEGGTEYLFLSGGIGITPILAMLARLRTLGVRARLVHLCRSREDLCFGDWIAELADFHDVHLHFDLEAGGLYDLGAELARTAVATEVYCCGPAPLMAAVQKIGAASGRERQFHFEYFTPPAQEADAAAEGDEFTVIQQSTGRRIPVSRNKTMLAALREAGLTMKSECEYGVCGWCAVEVIEGEPRHFDSYLTEAERGGNKLVLPCVSRCASPTLVLAL